MTKSEPDLWRQCGQRIARTLVDPARKAGAEVSGDVCREQAAGSGPQSHELPGGKTSQRRHALDTWIPETEAE